MWGQWRRPLRWQHQVQWWGGRGRRQRHPGHPAHRAPACHCPQGSLPNPDCPLTQSLTLTTGWVPGAGWSLGCPRAFETRTGRRDWHRTPTPPPALLTQPQHRRRRYPRWPAPEVRHHWASSLHCPAPGCGAWGSQGKRPPCPPCHWLWRERHPGRRHPHPRCQGQGPPRHRDPTEMETVWWLQQQVWRHRSRGPHPQVGVRT
jgi:hypothetical protein